MNQVIPKFLLMKRSGNFIDYMKEVVYNMDPEYGTMTANELNEVHNDVEQIDDVLRELTWDPKLNTNEHIKNTIEIFERSGLISKSKNPKIYIKQIKNSIKSILDS